MEVTAPDINESYVRFAVVPGTNKIRFGLGAVKNIGAEIAESIIRERKAGGKYDSLENFLERVQSKNLNKKSLESLIKCGAMDCFGERGSMLANAQRMLDFNREIKDIKNKISGSLFGVGTVSLSRPTLKMEIADPADAKQKLLWEKELLGLYLSAHPFAQSLPLVKNLIVPSDELQNHQDNSWVTVAGVVASIKQIRTKKNELMCFVTLED